MGKGRGNANCTVLEDSLILNIDRLKLSKDFPTLKNRFFKIRWENGFNINCTLVSSEYCNELQLQYYYDKVNINYTVRVDEVRSNLGKGVNLYFICPSTGARCKNLYLADGSNYFLSRQVYKSMFYTKQLTRKTFRAIEKHLELEAKLELLEMKRTYKTYNGKQSKTYKRLLILRNKLETSDFIMATLIGKATKKLKA